MTAVKRLLFARLNEIRESSTGKSFLIQIIYFICGTVISGGAVFGELSPFGAAFIAAVPYRYLLTSVMGSIFGYIVLSPTGSFRYIAIAVAIGAIRFIADDIKSISRSTIFPSMVAFLPVFATGIALLFSDTSRINSFTLCTIEAVISASGAFFLDKAICLCSSRRNLTSFNQQELSCIVMSGCIMLMALGGLSIGRFSFGRALAVAAILLCAKYGGVTGGAIGGISTGIVFSLSSLSYSFLCGGFGFGGLMAGLFSVTGKIGTAAAFLMSAVIMSFTSGNKEIVIATFIEALFGAGLFMMIPKSVGNTVSALFSPTDDVHSGLALKENVIMRLNFTSKALKDVSSCVTRVSKKMNSLCVDSFGGVYDNARESVCSNCGMRVFCWEREKGVTEDDFNRLTDTLKNNTCISPEDIDSLFVKKCCRKKEIANAVTKYYQSYLMSMESTRRISAIRNGLAGEFGGLSEILSDMAQEFSATDVCDLESSERISHALRQNGLLPILCNCRIAESQMIVEIELSLRSKGSIKKTTLRKEIEKCCGRRFLEPVTTIAQDRVRVVLNERPLYETEIGTYQHIADNGRLCGDSTTYFNDDKGNMVALISDGMGTGGRAAVDSMMATNLMEKLIKSGLSFDCALSLTNSALMVKSQEESLATIDITVFNLFTGKARLLKAGAPYTYIKKRGRVYRKEIPSIPAGILNEVKFTEEETTLSGEDMVLMLSDGAIMGDDKWLLSLIKSWNKGSCQELAEAVVEEAMRQNQDLKDDDITVMAIRLKDNY
ncbi:MAG: SpoIIE family protein phosphatase [Oscillospiraceae bacterium]|nr:SpoIIE family protein phosphatase [Oscillospiraceae bacterium]